MIWDTAERLNVIRPPVKAAPLHRSDDWRCLAHPLPGDHHAQTNAGRNRGDSDDPDRLSALLAAEAAGALPVRTIDEVGLQGATFKALFKGQKNLEPWLREYISRGNGVDFPGETRIIAGKSLEC